MVAQIRSPHAQRPVVYLYEAVPGGVGMAARLFQRHDELVAGAKDLVGDCRCEDGCPACTGPRGETGGNGRVLAERLLGLLRDGTIGSRAA
nr:DUF1998 domain-containing protein [Chloroflexota bacterium]